MDLSYLLLSSNDLHALLLAQFLPLSLVFIHIVQLNGYSPERLVVF